MSTKVDYKTPEWIYKMLDEEFHFDFDPCPLKHDIKEWDGLDISWGNVNFINPPYKENAKWLKKGFEEWKEGKTCVFLIPSRTDAKYFHEFCLKADEIRFIQGRLKFGGAKNSSPFPSMIVIFKK